MSSPRQKFFARAKELGVIVQDSGTSLSIDAPKGYIFCGSLYHYHCIDYGMPRGAWKMNDVYLALIDEMKRGVEKCEELNCRTCNEEE